MYKFQPVLELLRNKSVPDLQDAFGEDYGSDKGICLDTFTKLLKSKLRLDVREHDAQHLFDQIDRYSKGSVTSEELGNYLIAYEKKRLLPDEGPYENSPSMHQGVRSQDSIIQWILYPEDPEIADEMAGHYVFVSKHGFLSVWSKDMTKRFETTIETTDDGATGKTSTWATGLACLPREKLLAVSTTAGDIRFFRSSIYKFEHRFSIVCLPDIVLRLSCHESEMLVCGDFSGGVYVVRMRRDFFARNRRRSFHLEPEKLIFDHLKTGRVAGLHHLGTAKMHLTPVQRVEYVPGLNAVISCSVHTRRAMMVHFLENNESLSFSSADGIICFAFCHRLNCIITGGADHAIKVWNPTLNTSYNESMTGHSSPVNHLRVMEDRLYLVSSDREKTVRVWDLLRPGCLQVIKFQESEFPGKQSFASLFLDPTTGSLIVTTYRIGKLELYRKSFRDRTHPCSEYVVLASYSCVYGCLVTVGNSGAISVWDEATGRLVYEYEKSHEILDSDGFPRNVSVMTAELDPSGRRLVTADRVGMVKVWNFHLGLCLKRFEAGCTVLSLCLVGFHVYAAGSTGSVVHLYDDGSPEGETVETVPFDEARHCSSSVVSMDYYGRHLLASASGDGEIIVWLRRSAGAKIFLKDLEKEGEEDVEPDEQFLAKSELARRRKCSVSQILFLRRREMDSLVGNLVSCGTDGRIRFWNVVSTNKVNQGRILSRFRAVFRKCDGVLCLATDAENRYLISGDTMGYVRVYDLDDYYSAYGSAPPRSGRASSQQVAKFPFLRLQALVDRKHPKHSKFPKNGGSELGFVPFLLNCFRAHMGAVLKVEYVCERDMLITVGKESSVRLWTLSGVYAGRLGPSEEPWGFEVGKGEKRRMPPDVRTFASSLTLFVMNNGNTPHWTRALDALRNCRLGHQPENFTEKPLRWRLKKSPSAEDLTARGGTLEEDLTERLPYFRGTRPCKQKFFQDLNAGL